ncbi:MAG: galactose mutarotase [Cyclobacteriaceae bacterium]|nr:galactose mutarotase [Cyclobacteriaceae bacterium]
MINNTEILEYTLKNQLGMVVKVINYGGTITEISVPDRKGKLGNVILGFDSLEDYRDENNPYLGCFIGRYANRIGSASFKIDGHEYHLTQNNNGSTLHGGNEGFHRKIWTVEILSDSSLMLRYDSPHGDEGFPGILTTQILMTLGSDNSIRMDYQATTDAPTPVNLTNHIYFNLSHGYSPTILEHKLTIAADSITTVDDLLIPTGDYTPVTNTPFDFTKPKNIGLELQQVSGGYDHNFVLNKKSNELLLAATVADPTSGRKLELFTTEPGLQFYSGNFLDGSLTGKSRTAYVKHSGFCLEPQHFPDSPNKPHFPNTILKPGETYRQTSVFRFSVE